MLSRVLNPTWPVREYLLSERHALLYCPIPKVACSSLKHWFRGLEGLSESAVQPDIHAALRARYSLGRYSRRRAEETLRSNVYKVAFVRNPHDRLASAFMNKFVPGKRPALKALLRRRRLGDGTGLRLWAGMLERLEDVLALRETELRRVLEGFTFRDFVAYVAADDPRLLDKHWRPQYLFLGHWEFDFVGHFETLEADFAELCQRLGVEARLPHRNRTAYAAPVAAEACFADCPVAELRKLPALPPAASLYTPELRAAVSAAYFEDIARFGYGCETQQPRAAA